MSILIAYNLETYRKEKKLTQRELSNVLDSVSKSAITLYEKNQRTPSVEIQEKICKVLDINLETLNGQEQKNFLTDILKKSLLDDDISASEYQYIHKYFINFFNNDYYFSLKNTNLIEYEKRATNYLIRNELEINNYLKDKNIELTRKNRIMQNIILFLNSFISFALALKDRNNGFFILNTKIPLTKELIKNNNLNIEFFKILVELKPIYIEILDKLNNIYLSKDISIPIYSKEISNVIGYIQVTSDLINNNYILHAIKVENDFMYPRFATNDFIILRENEKYETGQFVAIVDEKRKIFLGKLKCEKNFIILQPINSNYSPLLFSNGSFEFLGEIIETRYNK